MSRKTACFMFLFFLFLSTLFLDAPFVEHCPPAHAGSNESSRWILWAKRAWSYFKPREGLGGVDPDTGLSFAGLWYHYFTEWDLGTYILAILDAGRIGILPRGGKWGSTYRLNKIMNFLKNRGLTPEGVSYLWYDSTTGEPVGDVETNVSDLGFLLIALHALKMCRPEYASTIEYVINREEAGIAKLASDPDGWRTTSGVYKWYVAHGFKYFGFDVYSPVQEALDTLSAILDGPKLSTYGVELPIADITSEPLLLAAFTLDPEPGMFDLIYDVCLAQENRYGETWKFTGFSEGNTDLSDPSYVYEWIVRSAGETWKTTPADITPIVYIKVGFGFYALLREHYALDLVNHVEDAFTNYGYAYAYGYMDGVDENGRVVTTIIDRTNGIILASARYALEHLHVTVMVADKETKLPVQGASVYMDDDLKGTTDANGMLVISNVLKGEHILKVTKAGYEDYEKKVNIKKDTMVNVRLKQLPRPVTLTVIVIDKKTKLPIQGASVYLDGELRGVTDENGILLIANVPPGKHVLKVTKEGYQTYEKKVDIKKDTTVKVKLRLI